VRDLAGVAAGKSVVTGGAKSVRKKKTVGKGEKNRTEIQNREMSSRRLAPDGDGSVVMRPC